MDILAQIYQLLIVSLAAASVSWTVTQEEIFREPREWFKKGSESSSSFLLRKFFYVFTCEYCFSHWVSLFFLVLTGMQVGIDDWRGGVLAFFVVTWLSNQWMSLYRRLRVEIKHENALAEKVKKRS